MAAPTVPSNFLHTFVGTLCDQVIMSTFWWRLIDKGTAVNVLEIEDDFISKINAVGGLTEKYLALCPNNYTLDEIWMQQIWPTRLMKSVYPQGIAGTSGFVASTANLAWAIERRGEVADRRSVGSLRGPIATDPLLIDNGGILNLAYKAAMDALAVVMKTTQTTPVKSAIFNPVVWNPRNAVFLPAVIVQVLPKHTVRTSHRRTVGLGI